MKIWHGLIAVLVLFGVAHAKPEGERREVQRHGVLFEKWVRDTLFDGYEAPSYTQEWDVAKEANKQYGGLPVSIKFTKYGTSVDLGDALRQFQINETFLIIIGYWKQEGDKKRVVNMIGCVVEPAQYQALWSPITLDDLKKLDAVVKDKTLELKDARAQAQAIKKRAPFTKAVMTVNPKLDANQRRLQCSLRFGEVFARLAPKADPSAQEKPQLFGIDAPPPFESKPRGSQ